MAATPAIVATLAEILEREGAFKARRMFGGHGLYLDGQFFAILDNGALFFRVSEKKRPKFEAEGMKPFTYKTKTGVHALKTYWRVPERLLDEPDELVAWVRDAVTAGRAKTRKAAAKKRQAKKPSA